MKIKNSFVRKLIETLHAEPARYPHLARQFARRTQRAWANHHALVAHSESAGALVHQALEDSVRSYKYSNSKHILIAIATKDRHSQLLPLTQHPQPAKRLESRFTGLGLGGVSSAPWNRAAGTTCWFPAAAAPRLCGDLPVHGSTDCQLLGGAQTLRIRVNKSVCATVCAGPSSAPLQPSLSLPNRPTRRPRTTHRPRLLPKTS